MQALRELAYIVARNKLRSIGHIDDDATAGSKTRLFYEKIIQNELDSDEDAAVFFYGKKAKKTASAYQKLKGELTGRLINTLFFIDSNQPSFTDRQRAYYECYRQWAAAKILLGKNARQAGIALCRRILKQAKRFEFTELVLDIARMLRLHYGTQEGDLKKFDHFNRLFREYEEIWLFENRAEELYSELIIRYVNNKATHTAVHKQAEAVFRQLQGALEKHKTYVLQLCGFLIKATIYSSLNDYKQTLLVCDEAVRLFEAKQYQANIPLQIFLYQKMVCHTQLKQYAEAEAVVLKALSFFEEGTFNWFKFQELYFLLSMHTGEYQRAYRVYARSTGHRRFRFLPENVRELWRIHGAYVHYLAEAGCVRPDEDDSRFSKFRLGRFLNNTPIFSRDKRGMNIPILIIQILFLIQKKRYDEAIDRIEAIEKYCSRYLKKGDTYRSNNFIKLLLQIPLAGFHRAAVERRAEKFLENLREVPLDMAGQSHDIEIIPYESLWEMALNSLGYNIHSDERNRYTRVY
jgi:tetratricopeptide (TPR) repeat protein